MLEAMQKAVFCGCCAALGLTLAEQILPAERFQKQIRMLFSVLLLTALLRPLTNLKMPEIASDIAGAKAYSEEIAALADSARENAVRESARNALNRELESRKVPCSVKEVLLHITEDGSICIDEVRITGNLLTGAVYLHEWLGADIAVKEWKEGDAVD